MIELAICVILVSVVALNALRRMDYLSASGAPTIRMTDASRNALVARNIVDGHGYAANDLPAALVDFYDQKGKLHDEHWVNADRFPFASYAVAALYTVVHSTSWVWGILIYNLLCFVGFLVLLYHCGRSLWRDRYAGMLAVAVALLHPYTFMFLYWKDGDMLLMTTAAMALLYRYFRDPPEAMSWRFALGMGTILAWVFLSRPNLGAPFVLVFGLVALVRIVRAARATSVGAALRRHLGRELLVLATALIWVLPFVIHSMRAWGQPLFSANNLYQLPLGTRFDMGTDTWWKYTEPGRTPTLDLLMHDGTGELGSKFTSSWASTARDIATSYGVELLLLCGLVVWLGRRVASVIAPSAEAPASPSAEAPASAGVAEPSVDVFAASTIAPETLRAARVVAAVIGFALLMNLVVLPLYGYQSYSYRHYMSFGLPVLWLACGRALSLIARRAAVGCRQLVERGKPHWAILVAIAAIAAVAINVGVGTNDANWLFSRIAKQLAAHWVALLIIVGVVVLRRWLVRPPWFPRLAILAFSIVYSCYRPNTSMKRANLVWLTADDGVWTSLRKHAGVVSSLALQGEVAWNTGRKNIPAPEWPMHIYSMSLEHELEIADLYIESAAALISRVDGPFSIAAPGFEGYARLQKWRALPGYEVLFHGEADLAYPKFRIKPHFKASTDFHLSDPAAFAAMLRSPDHLQLSDPRQVIYTAHGWGDYYELDGKPVVAATDASRARYRGQPQAPYEDTSITFFLDARRPRAVDVEIYSTGPQTFEWFWNLDLYAYDRPRDRPGHAIGRTAVTSAGWHTVHLEVPAGGTRLGLNKLGFRAGSMLPVVLCPEAMSNESCLAERTRQGAAAAADDDDEPVVVRPAKQVELAFEKVTAFVHAVDFRY